MIQKELQDNENYHDDRTWSGFISNFKEIRKMGYLRDYR